jgi:hypothetical protein
MVKEQSNKLKLGAAVVVGIVAGGLGAGLVMEPEQVVQEKIVELIKEVPVQVEVPVEVIVEVPVSDGRLDDIVQHIFDRDGDVEYIIDEYDADEVDEIADAFIFVHDMVKQGSDLIKEDFADEVDREIVSGVELDEDDVERIRIDDDLDEIQIDDFDAQDGELEITYQVRFEHDDVDYEAEVLVEVKDGEIDDMEVVSINEA